MNGKRVKACVGKRQKAKVSIPTPIPIPTPFPLPPVSLSPCRPVSSSPGLLISSRHPPSPIWVKTITTRRIVGVFGRISMKIEPLPPEREPAGG